MKLNVVTLLPVLIALSIVGQSSACGKKQNKTSELSRAKREGPSFGETVAIAAGEAMGVIKQGAAIKGSVSAQAGN